MGVKYLLLSQETLLGIGQTNHLILLTALLTHDGNAINRTEAEFSRPMMMKGFFPDHVLLPTGHLAEVKKLPDGRAGGDSVTGRDLPRARRPNLRGAADGFGHALRLHGGRPPTSAAWCTGSGRRDLELGLLEPGRPMWAENGPHPCAHPAWPHTLRPLGAGEPVIPQAGLSPRNPSGESWALNVEATSWHRPASPPPFSGSPVSPHFPPGDALVFRRSPTRSL
ncbi:uncharacterized protein LOC125113371 [Phacochoerus africanus]|uniref:uncharacterized protein LOC125113371 n=1 Tax=Phacochoerus africanus TaxID=41426 RepID=UPI001FD8B96E|nr:uncharacterized protein LOC125113371 [Phacochoerus africanus]